MKSFVATMCFFMFGALFVMPALAGVEDAPEGADPDTFYDSVDDSGREIYLENGGTTLIFDKSSGNMILWTDANRRST